MNLGKVDPKLKEFVAHYKKFGYATKTELANDAFRLLKQAKAAEARKRWREEASKEKTAGTSERAWEKIDDEDFK